MYTKKKNEMIVMYADRTHDQFSSKIEKAKWGFIDKILSAGFKEIFIDTKFNKLVKDLTLIWVFVTKFDPKPECFYYHAYFCIRKIRPPSNHLDFVGWKIKVSNQEIFTKFTKKSIYYLCFLALYWPTIRYRSSVY